MKRNEKIVGKSRDYVLIKYELGSDDHFEAYWNEASQTSFYLVSLKDGSRKILKKGISNLGEKLQFSPTGKWIIFYDFKSGNYFSYEIATGMVRSITGCVANSWIDLDNDEPEPQLPDRLVKWLENDDAVLINDGYDIWLIDPSGCKIPVNLTNAYGRKHRIKFDVLNDDASLNNFSVQKGSLILFKAINTINKDWGFYSKALGTTGNPAILSMGPYIYGLWAGQNNYNYPPIKAKNAGVYLVLRSNESEAPNYFLTTDFKTFEQLSNVQPQKNYNWDTTKLHRWESLDGTSLQGILYKPENFDSTKKIPEFFLLRKSVQTEWIHISGLRPPRKNYIPLFEVTVI